MNRKSLFIGMIALIIPAGFALAQPAEPKEPFCSSQPCGPKEFRGPHGPGRPGGPHGPGEPVEIGPAGMLKMFDRVAEMLPKRLEMTDEQKSKFQEIVKKNRAELEEIVKKLEAQRQKFDIDLNTILTPQQQEKLQELKKQRDRMMMRRPGMEEERDRPGAMMKAIKQLDLPPERAEKVEAIVTDAKAKFKEAPKGDREARQTIMREMMDKLRDSLTPEEMDRMREIMREQMGPGKGMHRDRRGGPGRGMGPGPQGPDEDCR